MENAGDIIFLIFVSTLLFLTLALLVVVFVVLYQKRFVQQKQIIQEQETIYRQRLLESVMETQEEERQRIARNVHDDVGTLLNVAKMQLGSIRSADEHQHEKLGQLGQHLQESIDQLRAIARSLSPPVLDKLGLFKALEDLAGRTQDTGAVEISFSGEEGTAVSKELSNHLYRMVQEIFTNTLKYAAPAHMSLDFHSDDAEIRIHIRHDGKGLMQDEVMVISESGKAFGLNNILSRGLVSGTDVRFGRDEDEYFIQLHHAII
ncbi:MAG: histidine kinase [Chitinophagales bacterium]|nr:hypothetical protein [Chitinophagales bacterium]HPE97735.1 histidine kinase [Chitinophagales bacterium]